jgi:small glutamine-rich tetratricopeptide repeat-containing protein alpha
VVFAIVEYLHFLGQQEGIEAESLEVASQCLSSEFGLDINDSEQQKLYSIKPSTLDTVFAAGISSSSSNKDTKTTTTTTTTTSSETKKDVFDLGDANLNAKFIKFIDYLKSKNAFSSAKEGTPEYLALVEKAKVKFLEQQQKEQQKPVIDIEKAESFKTQGNQFLTSKQYSEAIESYSKAIEFNPENAIYYCNRAAAHSFLGQHEKAIDDCKASISKDPKYSKAYSRLGLAFYSLGNFRESKENYEKALEYDPNNQSIQEMIATLSQKLPSSSDSEVTSGGGGAANPNFADLLKDPSIQDMARNLAGSAGAGAGGTPNIGSLLSDPNFMNMAQNMMSNPQFSQMFNDPNMRNMAQRMMNDPSAMSGMMNNLFTQDKKDS